MKIKLLKKIRKRFSWYLTKNGFPVLINHSTKNAQVIDLEYLKSYYKYSNEDVEVNVTIPHTEWAFRCMLHIMVKEFGYSYNNMIYRTACRRAKIKAK